jgi:hypothetical protein
MQRTVFGRVTVPCTFLMHQVILGDSLLLQLRFYSANYRFTIVPYLFLTLGMNDGHTEDTIPDGRRRIPKIWLRRNPPPSTTDIWFDDRIWVLSSGIHSVLHNHTALVTLHLSSTQERLYASLCSSVYFSAFLPVRQQLTSVVLMNRRFFR